MAEGLFDRLIASPHLSKPDDAPVAVSDLYAELFPACPFPPPKAGLTSFDVSAFWDAILTNLLTHIDERWTADQLRDLCQMRNASLALLSFADIEVDELLRLEFALTILLHFSKNVQATRNGDAISILDGFCDRMAKLLAIPDISARPLRVLLVMEPFDQAELGALFAPDSIFRRNLAEFFFSLRSLIPCSEERKACWTLAEISSAINDVAFYCINTQDSALGFVTLRGFVINATKLPLFAGRRRSAYRNIYLVTLIAHELSHYLRRRLIAGGDINFSTPVDLEAGVRSVLINQMQSLKRMLFPSEREDVGCEPSLPGPSNTASPPPSATAATFLDFVSEFGRFTEVHLFGGRFRWRKIVQAPPPAVVRSYVAAAVDTLTNRTISAEEFLANDGHAVFSVDQIAYLKTNTGLFEQPDQNLLCLYCCDDSDEGEDETDGHD